MKINRAFPIEKLMASIDYYLETTNRRITFEYILLNDVNDHVEEAKATCKIACKQTSFVIRELDSL